MWLDECFPRKEALPAHSPLFWVTHKDRYLRQLLIADIERATGRDLLVYFTDIDNTQVSIDAGDDQYLVELLTGKARGGVDLLLETAGGGTDATEKLCSVLRQLAPDLRVIVPRAAKSNGTVVALTGHSVVMAPTSELGPIDPSIGGIPAAYIVNAPADFQTGFLQYAVHAIKQTRDLATKLLSTGMMQGKTSAEIQAVVDKLASRDHYASHGCVIDSVEAQHLGLTVEHYATDDELWRKLWLLRTMYAYDCPRNGYAKVFESLKWSTAVAAKAPAP